MAEQDKYFLEQSEVGKRLREQGITPRANFAPTPSQRDRVMSALLAFQQGAQAAQKVAPQGDAFGSFLAGAAGGIGAPSAQDLANKQAEDMAKAQMAQFEATPIDEVSPDIVERFPELKGVPLGFVNRISPLLQRHDDIEKKMALMEYQNKLMMERAEANIGAAAKERKELDTIDDVGASAYSQTYNIPASFFSGKRRKDIDALAPSLRKTQQIADLVNSSEAVLRNLRDKFYAAVGKSDATSQGLKSIGSKVTFGAIAPEFKEYEEAKNAALTTIRGLFKDSGAPSNFDVTRLENYLPSIDVWRTAPAAADKKWAGAFGLVSDMKTSAMKSYPTAQYYFGQGQAAPAPKPRKSLADLLKESGL